MGLFSGSYILAEVDGSVWHQKIARFRVVPYFAREQIKLPEGILAIIDCNEDILDKIERQVDLDDSGKDYLMEGVKINESDNEDEDIADNIE